MVNMNSGNNINLKEDFRALMKKVQKWAIIRRYDKSQKCSCRRHSTTDQADASCNICAGMGYPYFEQPIHVYEWSQTGQAGLAFGEMSTTIGQFAEEGMAFFIDVNEKVATSDELFEVALDSDGKIILPEQRLAHYDISFVQALRGDNQGATEFLVIYAAEHEEK